MGVNTSSETLSPGLSEHNSLVVTPDRALTRRVQAPTSRQSYFMAFQGK